MSFSARLLLTSLVTLAVGLGALVVAGNVLLDRRVAAEVSNELRVNAQAQLATLAITSSGVTVREAPNDEALDHHGWVIEGDRVIERATNVSPALDATAIAHGPKRAFGDHDADGDGDIRLRVVPITAPGRAQPVGAVVVALSTAPLENLQKEVLVGSLVIAALVLLAGAIALRTAIARASEPVVQMTSRAEDWGAHDLDRRFTSALRATSSPAWPRRSTACWIASPRHADTSSASRARWPTSSVHRSPVCGAGPSWPSTPPERTRWPRRTMPCARSSRGPRGSRTRSTPCSP
jgi:hypothetical protein